MQTYIISLEHKQELLKWAEFLETTDLEQGLGTLCQRNDDESSFSYCCLGAYVTYKNGNNWNGYWSSSSRKYYSFTLDDDQYEAGDELYILGMKYLRDEEDESLVEYTDELPPEFAELLGFLDGDNYHLGLEQSFIRMNDEFNMTFSDIAEEIRYLVEHDSFTEETANLLMTTK